jgi:penicillin amidase
VVAGHNQHIAWGVVNGGVSIQGLFVERFNPNNPLQFEDPDGWQDAVRFREVIHVRGGKPAVEDVLVTRRGPIISPAFSGQQPPISLRWVGLDAEVDSHGWVMRLNQAHDWKTFRAAIASFPSPSLAVTYADTGGNIGYRLSGFIPIRPAGHGRLPARGWVAGDQWQGFVPLEEMPEAFNPPGGVVIAANNPPAPDACPHPLFIEPSTGYRARRIHDTLEAKERITVDDCVALQGDVESLPGARLRRLFLDRLVGGQQLSPDPVPATGDGERALGLRMLRDWDCRLGSDSAGGLLYQRLLARLTDNVIADRVSPAARRYIQGGSVHDLFPQGPFGTRLTPTVLDLLESGRTALLARPDDRTRDALLGRVLVEVVSSLRRERGADPARWHWGDVQQVRFDHPLAAAFSPLAPILSRGPFAGRGDNDTVRLCWRGATNGILAPVGSAFWRAVYDLGDWSRSVGSHTPGQSGHPASRHYADRIDGWLGDSPSPIGFGAQPEEGERLVLLAKAS